MPKTTSFFHIRIGLSAKRKRHIQQLLKERGQTLRAYVDDALLDLEAGGADWTAHNESSHIPNARLRASFAELEQGKGKRFNTVEELMADLNADD